MNRIVEMKCPKCGEQAYAEGVDVGVGYRYPPMHCDYCHWSEKSCDIQFDRETCKCCTEYEKCCMSVCEPTDNGEIDIEKAIKFFSPPYDWVKDEGDRNTLSPFFDIALQALKEKFDRDNPVALTFEELKQMEDEPVYEKSADQWYVIDSVDFIDDLASEIVMTDDSLFHSDNGNELWFDIDDDSAEFYKEKPKGE